MRFILAFLLLHCAGCDARTFKWTGLKSTLWDDNGNWYTEGAPGIPGAGDDVVIDTPAAAAVVVVTSNLTIASLTMGADTTGSALLQLQAEVNITGVAIVQPYGKVQLESQGARLVCGNMDVAGAFHFTAGTLSVSSMLVTGSASFLAEGVMNVLDSHIQLATRFPIAASGTLSMQGNSTIFSEAPFKTAGTLLIQGETNTISAKITAGEDEGFSWEYPEQKRTDSFEYYSSSL